jgi:hypothetical protein
MAVTANTVLPSYVLDHNGICPVALSALDRYTCSSSTSEHQQ